MKTLPIRNQSLLDGFSACYAIFPRKSISSVSLRFYELTFAEADWSVCCISAGCSEDDSSGQRGHFYRNKIIFVTFFFVNKFVRAKAEDSERALNEIFEFSTVRDNGVKYLFEIVISLHQILKFIHKLLISIVLCRLLLLLSRVLRSLRFGDVGFGLWLLRLVSFSSQCRNRHETSDIGREISDLRLCCNCRTLRIFRRCVSVMMMVMLLAVPRRRT